MIYIRDHWVYLGHDQRITNSVGASHVWNEPRGTTRVYADTLYDSGLRKDEDLPDGTPIPNGGHVPAYNP